MVSAGYGQPKTIRRSMTIRQFSYYLDATRRRRHTDKQFAYQLAGGDQAEWPDYESPVEGQLTNEQVEAMLASSPYVRRAPDPVEPQSES